MSCPALISSVLPVVRVHGPVVCSVFASSLFDLLCLLGVFCPPLLLSLPDADADGFYATGTSKPGASRPDVEGYLVRLDED